jgi:glyoxylase-like metal-dependent hydrolase (beta-lactamase superfamily II)
MNQPAIIDTKMHGRPGITGAFVVAGEQTALVETGPKSSVEAVLSGLESLGIESCDWIVVTHIHLDHAGAAGTLAGRWPDARVAVHPVGAPHLVDPSKLWSSAARIYGDLMEELWGGIDPIAEERLVVLDDGDVVDLGGRTLRAVETPGHARHHHAFVDDATGACFVGDALGVRLQDVGIVLGARSLHLTHYGRSDSGEQPMSSDEVCDGAIESLRKWEGLVREARRRHGDDLDSITERVKAAARDSAEMQVSPEGVDRLEQTTSYRMNVSGYVRYLQKIESAT